MFDAKRMIGRKFHDPTIQADMKHWPFVVKTSGHEKCEIEVDYKGARATFSPEEVRWH